MNKEQFNKRIEKDLFIAGSVFDRIVINTLDKHHDLFIFSNEKREQFYKIANEIDALYNEFKQLNETK